MIVDEIFEMDKTGKLKLFLRTGVISLKVKCYYDIYRRYEVELKANKHLKDCIMQSVSNTANAFNVSDDTVFRAKKLMTR